MTDHKFEPFEKVLVRDDDSHDWNALFYSHRMNGVHMCGGVSWKQCIPYAPDTAHLLGTPQPYEPPKPPQEYDLVEALEQAEAENDRLTKMVDWLAERAAIYAVRTEQHIAMRSIWGQIEAARTAVDGGYQLEKSSTTVEAARQAVADESEVKPCQK